MLILSTKLKNVIIKANPNTNLEFKLKNIIINHDKRGCSGFIVNTDNNAIVYVNTEVTCLPSAKYMYRYADSTSDYTGYHNRWAPSLETLVSSISTLLKTPVSETNDKRL